MGKWFFPQKRAIISLLWHFVNSFFSLLFNKQMHANRMICECHSLFTEKRKKVERKTLCLSSCYYLNSKVIWAEIKHKIEPRENVQLQKTAFVFFTIHFLIYLVFEINLIQFNSSNSWPFKETKQYDTNNFISLCIFTFRSIENIFQFYFTKWYWKALERASKHCSEFGVFCIFTYRNCEFFIEVALKSARKDFRKNYLNSIETYLVYALHKGMNYRWAHEECVQNSCNAGYITCFP